MADEQLSTQEILGQYQGMTSECRSIMSKIGELNLEKDEHRLVIDTMNKLSSDRRAYRLVGGILVARTVGEVLPQIAQNYEGITQILEKLNDTLKNKDAERKAYKEKHGIMTQEEKQAFLKRQERAEGGLQKLQGK